MKRSTWMIVGATVLALGVGVLALGFASQDATVRQVSDVLDNPSAHQTGPYILIGIPQPETIQTPNGTTANPLRQDSIEHVTAWQSGGQTYHATHRTTVTVQGGLSMWSYSNQTRLAGQPDVIVASNHTWQVTWSHTVFQIDGFPDANGNTPRLWGIYEGILRDPVQAKPSQFTGHLTRHVGESEVPLEAHVFYVDQYTAGCSSKFLPDDHKDQATT